ncbi:MAG: nucleotide exchange factor GrpE [Caldicoprobacterales bacterium]|nr:nucleotide exchange factor GrpE [Clostridia bacterium]MDI9511929.1 nucleotide exchange factor GrpE [Bacillota bacterium]NLH58945.1 nucleotide exchange factor GrpE [Clostridiales bacterium]
MEKKQKKDDQPIVNEEFIDDIEQVEDLAQDLEENQPATDEGKQKTKTRGKKASLERELDDLKNQLKEVEKQKEDYLSMAQRLQADFENYKRRNKNLVADTYLDATCQVVSSFLPVLDNLDRAIASFKELDADEAMLQGVKMIQKQFVDCLEKQGVTEIEALNQPFDPDVHEAVMQVEAEEGQEPDTVVAVLQKGYRTKDRVIRYSMVSVAK